MTNKHLHISWQICLNKISHKYWIYSKKECYENTTKIYRWKIWYKIKKFIAKQERKIYVFIDKKIIHKNVPKFYTIFFSILINIKKIFHQIEYGFVLNK